MLIVETVVRIRREHAKPGRVFLGVVQRLDRPVSGVVVFARTSKAAERLAAEFRDGRALKAYRAIGTAAPRPSRSASGGASGSPRRFASTSSASTPMRRR